MRWRWRILIALLVLPLIVVGALLVAIDSAPVRAWLKTTIETAASTPGEMEVTIDDLGPGLPGALRIGRVSLADGQGPWLLIEDVALDWNPWALIGGTVDVEVMTVGSVALLREPVSDTPVGDATPPADEGFALPEPPGIAVVIDRLEIADIAIDASVMGEAARYRLTGSADLDEGGAGRLALDLDRLGGAVGKLSVRSDIDLARNNLTIDAAFNEGPDGLLVHLLDIAPYPAVSASLKAQGSVHDWQGTLSFVLAETADLEADFTVRQSDDGTAVAVQGSAHPGGLLDDETARLVGESVTFAAEMQLADERLTIASAQVGADPADVAVRGTVELDTLVLDLVVEGQGRQTAAVAELATPAQFESWTLRGHLGGSAEAPALDAVLDLEAPSAEGIAAAGARLDLTAATDGQDNPWRVDGTLTLRDPDVGDALGNAQLGAGPSLHVAGAVGAAFDSLALDSVTLTMAAGTLTTGLDLAVESGMVDLKDLRADLPLAPFSQLAGLDLSGSVAASGDVTVENWGDKAEGELRLAFSDLATGEAALDAILGSTPGIALTLSGGGDRLTISSLDLDLPVWSATGTLDIDLAAGTVEGKLGGAFRTTPALAAEVDPALSIDGNLATVISGKLEAPILDVRLDVARGAYDGMPLDGAMVDLRELSLNDGLQAAVRATVPTGQAPLAAQAALVFDAAFSRLEVRNAAITGPGVEAGGNLVVTLDGPLVEGKLAGRLPDLAGLGDTLGIGPLSGAGVFDAVFAADGSGGQGVEAKLWMTRIGASDISADEIALAATVSDAMGSPLLDVRGSLLSIDLAGLTTADKALVRANGPLSALDVSLEARNAADPGWHFDLAGRVGLEGETTTIALSTLELNSGDHRIAATQTLNVTLDGQGVRTDTLALAIDEGSLTFNVRQGDDRLQGALKVDAVPVDIMAMFDPALVMKGRIDGTAEFDLVPGAGDATAAFEASQLVLPSAAAEDEARLSLKAGWHNQRLTVALDITGVEGLQADLKADWPLAFDHTTGNAEVPLQENVSASLTMQGEISRLWQHLPIGDQTLAGDIDIRLQATGKAADPAISGSAQFLNGRYENLEWGTLIDDITAKATATSDGALALQADANDSGQGRIDITGRAELNEHGRIVFDSKLTLANAQLVRRDDAKLTVGGDLTLEGTLGEGKIVGRFQTVEADLNVEQSLPGSVTLLNVEDVFDAKGLGEPPAAINPWRATLDIEIDMPGRIFVRGRGLDSEWKGKVTIDGSLADPQVSARLDLVRGNLDVVGRRFTLTSGQVDLVPADNGDPRFSVVAAISSGDVSGQLEVSGRLSQPELKVTTVPSLPEDEALARLMFGKGAGNLSGLEAIQLAGAIADITGNSTGGSDMLDRVRDTLGVDVLQVGTDDEGHATVGAGSYLADGVYVGVQQGAGAGSSGVVVNIDLTDNLSLETEAGADASGRVGVDWSWDY